MKSNTLATIGYCLVYAGIVAGMFTSYFADIPGLVDQIADFAILVGISLATGTLANNVTKTIENPVEKPNAKEIGSQVIVQTKEQQSNAVVENTIQSNVLDPCEPNQQREDNKE